MSQNRTLKDLTPDATVKQITTAGRYSADLLASIGLNPEEHEEETLRSVCQQRQWSEVEVLDWLKQKDYSQLNSSQKETEEREDVNELLSKLTEYYYSQSRELLKEIEDDFPRVLQIHGNQYTWLKNMKWHFDSFDEALQFSYKFKKKKFIPLTQQILGEKSTVLDGTIRKLERGFEIIERDRNRITNLMDTIREKGQSFKNPPNACSTLRIMNQNFEILFDTLDEQFELELQSLIPKVKEHIASLQ